MARVTWVSTLQSLLAGGPARKERIGHFSACWMSRLLPAARPLLRQIASTAARQSAEPLGATSQRSRPSATRAPGSFENFSAASFAASFAAAPAALAFSPMSSNAPLALSRALLALALRSSAPRSNQRVTASRNPGSNGRGVWSGAAGGVAAGGCVSCAKPAPPMSASATIAQMRALAPATAGFAVLVALVVVMPASRLLACSDLDAACRNNRKNFNPPPKPGVDWPSGENEEPAPLRIGIPHRRYR